MNRAKRCRLVSRARLTCAERKVKFPYHSLVPNTPRICWSVNWVSGVKSSQVGSAFHLSPSCLLLIVNVTIHTHTHTSQLCPHPLSSLSYCAAGKPYGDLTTLTLPLCKCESGPRDYICRLGY